jgi:hypothetical protein
MKRRALLLSGCCLSLVGACQASSVDAQQTTTINAVVETVDPISRELLLRGAGGAQSGRLLSVIVGSHVQRLDQIHPGDRVKVTYYEALAAQVVNVRSPTSQPFEGVSVNRTETANRPGGEVTNTVSFVGPDNLPRTVAARNPQVQSFIRTLRVGQQVDVVYEEALAISVEPMR